jgi:ketosteroid isomerase-like protein
MDSDSRTGGGVSAGPWLYPLPGWVYGRSYVRSSEHKSVSNQELCRQFADAYCPDRLDDLLALLHPDIEWSTTETWVEREVWYGHAGVRAGLRRFFSEWEEFSNDEVEAFSDGGDKFALVTRMRGLSRVTHIPTEMQTSGVVEVRDGLIVRVVGHSDPADALAVVANSAAAASPAQTGRSSRSP